jgi:hypothetical protein
MEVVLMKTYLLMMRKAVLIGSIFLLFFARGVIGATYYVAVDGNDSRGNGTEGIPWASIEHGVAQLTPGDSLIVKDGTYTDHDNDTYAVYVRVDGTSDNWITIRAENEGGVIIDGQNEKTTYGFFLYRADYVRIDGFEIKNFAHSGIYLRSSHDSYISKCNIWGIGREYLNTKCTSDYSMAGIHAKLDTYNVTVDKCTLHDIGPIHRYPKYGAICIYDYKRGPPIYAAGYGWLIQNCLFYNMYGSMGILITTHTGSTDRSTHIITNNTFAHDVNDGYETCNSFGAQGHIKHCHTFSGNPPHDVVIQNNAFYNPPGTTAIWSSTSESSTNSLTIRNNVTSASNIYVRIKRSGTPTLIDNTAGLSLASFGMTDPENNDFTLTSLSHLISQGIASLSPGYDHDGNIRPTGAGGPDIGAYEYEKTNSKPSKPTGLHFE